MKNTIKKEIYILKHEDTWLLEFTFDNEIIIGDIPAITKINKSKLALLPFNLEPNSKSLYKFLHKRMLPDSRSNKSSILKSLKLTIYDFIPLIQMSKCLSINDNYWVCKKTDKTSFANENLFDNDWSKELSNIAFFGKCKEIDFIRSPELTTNGTLPKTWRKINNDILLYKGFDSWNIEKGNECYAEYYASQIADCLGLSHVKYELIEWDNSLASVCPLFTSKDISFVPAKYIGNVKCLEHAVQNAEKMNKSLSVKIKDMILFDCIILNEDRHLGNFGYIYNSKTKEIIDVAPIFDNGNSLFHGLSNNDLIQLDYYSRIIKNVYRIPFDDLAKQVLNDQRKEMIRKLINFKFIRHEKYNWSEDRLKKTEEFIQMRIKELLEM